MIMCSDCQSIMDQLCNSRVQHIFLRHDTVKQLIENWIIFIIYVRSERNLAGPLSKKASEWNIEEDMIIMNYNYNYYKKIKRTQRYTVTSEVMHCWFKQCISLFACDFSQDLSLLLAHAGCGGFNFFFLEDWSWVLAVTAWVSLAGGLLGRLLLSPSAELSRLAGSSGHCLLLFNGYGMICIVLCMLLFIGVMGFLRGDLSIASLVTNFLDRSVATLSSLLVGPHQVSPPLVAHLAGLWLPVSFVLFQAISCQLLLFVIEMFVVWVIGLVVFVEF